MKDPFDSANRSPAPTPAVAPVSENHSTPAPATQIATNGAAPKQLVQSKRPAARRHGKRPGPAGKRPAGQTAGPARRSGPARPAGAHPSAPADHEAHHYDKLVDEGEESLFERHRTKIVFGAIALVFIGAVLFMKSGKPTTVSKAPPPMPMVSISMPKPPPPPPPPPPKLPPPPDKQEKMIHEDAPVEKKEEAPKPAAPEPTLGTNLKGDGAGMAGLGASGNGGGFGGGTGGKGGSKWGWYAGQVQNKVKDALHHNSKTKAATMNIQVRIWPDSTGRIQRAKLDSTTGDPKLDEAIQGALTNIQLQEPPPAGMPTPIIMRLKAVRP